LQVLNKLASSTQTGQENQTSSEAETQAPGDPELKHSGGPHATKGTGKSPGPARVLEFAESRLGLMFFLFALLGVTIWLLGVGGGAHGAEADHASLKDFLFSLVAILLAAKIGGELFERWNQPAVLGELIFGIVIGNLSLFGVAGIDVIRDHPGIAMAAEVGVILLLFEVGLESDLAELLEVGVSAIVVAVLGVVAPIVLGYLVSSWFLPESGWYVHLFAGATLAATSVGITARVLKDLGRTNDKESRIILGAAVVDDVLGLVLLAIITGIVGSIGSDGEAELAVGPVLIIILKSVLFLLGAVVAGRILAGTTLHVGSKAKVGGMPVVLSLCHCFAMAGLAELLGLAPIVGAFAAGLVLDQVHYLRYREMQARRLRIEELIAPISSIAVPVFFVVMGLQVDLRSFASFSVLEFAAALTVAAVIGKQICSLGVLEKGLNRWVVGVGMVPRGEVGLIFAGIGAGLMVAGKPVFGKETFSAMVVMVMVTSLATPPLLTALFGRQERDETLPEPKLRHTPGHRTRGPD